MKRIGIISDTHSYWDERYRKYLEPCDEIWHCGDFCSTEMADRLAAIRPYVPYMAMATVPNCDVCFPKCCASSVRR